MKTVLLAAIVVLSGCLQLGSPERSETPTTPDAPPAPNQPSGESSSSSYPGQPGGPVYNNVTDVELVDSDFVPANFTVRPQGNIRFRNNGTLLHHVVFLYENETMEGRFGGDVAPGSFVIAGHLPGGVYQLRCKYHSTDYQTGMVATMTVEGSRNITT